MLLDMLLACLALSAAYLLRYEGILEKRFVEQFVQVLPFIVIAKLPLLYFFGVYRSIWRYTGASDILAIAKAGTLGSLIAGLAVFLVYRAEAFNRSVLLLDWMLFLALLGGTRLSFVFMRDLGSRLLRHGLTRVVVVGANDTGELMLRALSRGRAFSVVGFLDDDPTKRHLAIHGVPVVGTFDDLELVVKRLAVQEVLVAVGSPTTRASIVASCQRLGVRVRDVGQFFLDLARGEAGSNLGRLPTSGGNGHAAAVPAQRGQSGVAPAAPVSTSS
jgi:FlaA1/EpsC-like NDP-sugar epimerase